MTSAPPDFVLLGAARAGTTALAAMLARHQAIFMADPKEPRYFVQELAWDRGSEWYDSLFAESDGRLRGEASTDYTKRPRFDGVAERLATTRPDVRLIYLVRDPLDRAASHWAHAVRYDGERRPIAEALAEERHYLDTSRYAYQLSPYLERFDAGQILVVQSERLREHAEQELGRVLAHLGTPPPETDLVIGAEVNASAPKLDAARDRTPLHDVAKGFLTRSGARRLVPAGIRHRMALAMSSPAVAMSDRFIPEEVAVRFRRELSEDMTRLEELFPTSTMGWPSPE